MNALKTVTADESDVILRLQGIRKSFDGAEVLNGISLSIKRGEFITFLGPSGCGKTTMIRILAGLCAPDEGSVILNGRDVTDDAPEKRSVNTVFQSYALFPHMNVAANVAYSLKIRKTPKDEISRRVGEILSLVQMEGYEKRMPDKLSGGQKQRVAIARAIINRPDILLLDEPLGALDLQLRRQMQAELKRLQKKLGITFVYITHDQEEAMNMSDRIVVMKDGAFEQIGSPEDVYEHPLTSFTAQFIGMANIINCSVASVKNDGCVLRVADGALGLRRTDIPAGTPVRVSVRSESITIIPCDGADDGLCGVVREHNYTGSTLRTTILLSDGTEIVSSRQGGGAARKPGDHVKLIVPPEHIVPVDLSEVSGL